VEDGEDVPKDTFISLKETGTHLNSLRLH
jgi:hypothetical protein